MSAFVANIEIFLILTNKLSVRPIENFSFLCFTSSALSETFIVKNTYLSTLIRICDVRTIFSLKKFYERKFLNFFDLRIKQTIVYVYLYFVSIFKIGSKHPISIKLRDLKEMTRLTLPKTITSKCKSESF